MMRSLGHVFCATLLACLAQQIVATSRLQVGAEPWFCHELDCPEFRVVETTDAYEVREYEAGVWASTTVESYLYAHAMPVGFRRLFSYIDGGNEDSVKIPMTSPVVVEVAHPPAGPFCKQNYTVSFFMPFDFQDDPPQPTDSSISIVESPPFTAYVAQSGGFKVEDFTLGRMASALFDALEAEGKEYDDSHFFFAGYDPPFRLTNRHNEIWAIAKGGAGSTSAEQ